MPSAEDKNRRHRVEHDVCSEGPEIVASSLSASYSFLTALSFSPSLPPLSRAAADGLSRGNDLRSDVPQ